MLSGTGGLRLLAVASLLSLALAFPAGQILSRRMPGHLSGALLVVGSLYLAVMIHAFMLALAADILRAVNLSVKLTPQPPPYPRAGRVAITAVIAFLSVALSLAGALNAAIPTVKRVSLDLPPHAAGAGDLRIAVISDIHFGRLVTGRHLTRLAKLVDAEKPDIILLAGDMVDDLSWTRSPTARADAVGRFRAFKADLGVWAIPGNHDHHSGIEKTADMLSEAGITLLRDEWAAPGERVLLIGREDRTVERTEARSRAALTSIRDEARRALRERFDVLPLIVLDHQPFNLSEADGADAFLQISGHTHRGQIFPFNFIVARLYENSYGVCQKGGAHYVVSSGAGSSRRPLIIWEAVLSHHRTYGPVYGGSIG